MTGRSNIANQKFRELQFEFVFFSLFKNKLRVEFRFYFLKNSFEHFWGQAPRSEKNKQAEEKIEYKSVYFFENSLQAFYMIIFNYAELNIISRMFLRTMSISAVFPSFGSQIFPQNSSCQHEREETITFSS